MPTKLTNSHCFWDECVCDKAILVVSVMHFFKTVTVLSVLLVITKSLELSFPSKLPLQIWLPAYISS